MSQDLIDLVNFLHADHPGIREVAADNLVGYSQGPHAHVFKQDDYRSIKDLKLLVKEKKRSIVENALTILINLCDDASVIDLIASDETFIEYISKAICDLEQQSADLFTILLANLAKNDQINTIFDIRVKIDNEVFKSDKIVDSLMDCFVKGANRALNKYATFDYLSYFFADLSRFEKGRKYFVTEQAYDHVIPITKLLVFTEIESKIRRAGVASTIKNALFDVDSHSKFIKDENINLLPYILLPLAGPEELDEDDMFNLPDELQLLGEDKKRDSDSQIICTHIESLLLLCTTKECREYLREKSVYAIIKELHKAVDDAEICERCDRIVQLLMRDEAPKDVQEILSDDEDEKIVEIL
ncbi:protein HGH1 [Nadsonia fulvescens var. elongata DSM 6958]|uniref:Protein HGH1 homolog n=1 Tax=Nadsonia fulvescens var. elongata DSM 6958 TaxID=857566 RepID=A0A1E3PMS0_9ASCO|nr:protein HGH1 [Nadsonia fulvescens var. elongata DSM 6958]